MNNDTPQYDLEERTFEFALAVRKLISDQTWGKEHWSDIDQILRSSGSVGANYIEANDSLSPKDFQYRIKICKKEAKESRYWARLLGCTCPQTAKESLRIIYQEAEELMKILAVILRNNIKNNTPS